MDDVAERARSLEGWAFGTLTEFTQHTRLTEHPGQYPNAREMIGNLVADHEALIRQLRTDLETCAEDGVDVKSIFAGRVSLAHVTVEKGRRVDLWIENSG